MTRSALVTAILCALAGCAHTTKGEAVAPLAAAPAMATEAAASAAPKVSSVPASLIADVAIATPEVSMDQLGALANAIQPGVGAMLTPTMFVNALAGMLGASALDGIDLAQPLRILVLNPKTQPRPLVLVAAVADEARLKTSVEAAPGLAMKLHGGSAAIAAEGALAEAGDFALTMLLGRPLPAAPTITLHLPSMVAAFGPELAMMRSTIASAVAGKGGNSAGLVEAEMSILADIGAQSERLIVTVEADGQGASLDFALAPKEGSALATFAAAQKPSDYALLDKLPASSSPVVETVVGRIALGPWRDKLVGFVLQAMAKGNSKTLDPAFRDGLATWMQLATGEIAGTAQADEKSGLRLTYVGRVTDSARAKEAMLSLLTVAKKLGKIELLGDKLGYDVVPVAFKYDGLVASSWSTTFEASDPEQAKALEKAFPGKSMKGYVAAFDDLMVGAMGKGGDALTKATIDSARHGKNKLVPGTALAAALADSRRRAESFVAYVVIGELMNVFGDDGRSESPTSEPSGAVLALGFADGSTHVRLAVPVALIRELKAREAATH